MAAKTIIKMSNIISQDGIVLPGQVYDVEAGQVIIANYGTITTNYGTVATNYGTVTNNWPGGTVTNNWPGGTITDNWHGRDQLQLR